MSIQKVGIKPGCITCGRCEFIAPEVFEVLDIAYVKKDADLTEHQQQILQAIKECPVNVIFAISDETIAK